MKLNRILILLAVLALGACTQILEEESQSTVLLSGQLQTKVVQLADEYDRTSFLVKFTSVPEEADLENILALGAVSVEKLFPSFKGKEDLEKEFGLDRWYEVTISDEIGLSQTIEACAEFETVAVCEYNHIASNKTDLGAIPATDLVPATKASSSSSLEFNDPYLSYQWNYYNTGSALFGSSATAGADINVKDVWETLGCGGDPEIIVAVVDEGVKYNHSDLAANMWVNSGEIAGNGIDDDGNGYIDDVYGYNFVNGGAITWTLSGDSGHATHCAGTIAAVNNNSVGVGGVAGGTGNSDGCRIMSCQIFSGNSGGTASIVAKAVKYAADMGASVISCSFGYSNSWATDDAYVAAVGSAEIDAIHYFEASKNNDVLDGGIAIFAAGNDAHAYAHYPGAYVDVISVSSFGPDFLPAYYTDYGPGCNICAPGGEYGLVSGSYASMVLSTFPAELDGDMLAGTSDYAYMQGTSMACPHVSGVVALALSYARHRGKSFTVEEFKEMILASTNDIDQRISKSSGKSYAVSGMPSLALSNYYHQMGTGGIDAWQLMMKIDGTPTIVAEVGSKQWLSLDSIFGTSSVSLTYLSVDVPDSAVSSLGLQEISATSSTTYPAVPESGPAYVQYGRLYVHPTLVGSGVITISAVGGGNAVGGGSNATGGMELTQEVSIISRPVTNDNGGWL